MQPLSAALRVLQFLFWILQLLELRQVHIFGGVMGPGFRSLRWRFSIHVLLICAQVVALFCQEDGNTGES